MTKKYKPRAGVGAKAKIFTKMIYPRRQVVDMKEESTVILIGEEQKMINRKQQECYTFTIDGADPSSDVFYAIKRYVHVFEEGIDAFDTTLPGPPKENILEEKKVKWKKSKAKRILYDLLMDGTIPMEDKDADGNVTMPIEDIFLLDGEFAKYRFDMFAGRLKRLRDKIKELDNRAAADLLLFNNYKSNHKPSLFSHKGYIQWQGSAAQEWLWDDLPKYLKDPDSKPLRLWLTRPEYRNEFPLDAFRDKIKQEIRTEKYLRTREARARGEKT